MVAVEHALENWHKIKCSSCAIQCWLCILLAMYISVKEIYRYFSSINELIINKNIQTLKASNIMF